METKVLVLPLWEAPRAEYMLAESHGRLTIPQGYYGSGQLPNLRDRNVLYVYLEDYKRLYHVRGQDRKADSLEIVLGNSYVVDQSPPPAEPTRPDSPVYLPLRAFNYVQIKPGLITRG